MRRFVVVLLALLVMDAQAASPDVWTWCKYYLQRGIGPMDVCGPDPAAILTPYCATDWVPVLGIGVLTPDPPFYSDDGGWRFDVPCVGPGTNGARTFLTTELAHRWFHCPVPENLWHDAAALWENGQVQEATIGHCPDNTCQQQRDAALELCNLQLQGSLLACSIIGVLLPPAAIPCAVLEGSLNIACRLLAPTCP